MTSQPDLFHQPPPFVAGSATSHEAAIRIIPESRNLRERVLAYIATHGPCTDEEIATGTDLNPSTVRPRRVELARSGRIVLEPRPGLTRSGRKAQRWTVAPPDLQGF